MQQVEEILYHINISFGSLDTQKYILILPGFGMCQSLYRLCK